MGQGGGWPLTVFLTPEQHPFYAGTYFPKEPKYGRPGFIQVLSALSDLYANKRDKVREQAAAFGEGLASIADMVDAERRRLGDAPSLTDPQTMRSAARALLDRIDLQWGGFGRAPKFPNPTALEILLRGARAPEGDPLGEDARRALELTLDKMYRGGIYDHLRGGFARYSVDRVWLVPHFEKMLYDNAQLLGAYAEAAVQWPTEVSLRRVVWQTVEYLVTDMRDEYGVFYAATDADSEGVEGKYFCWTPEQIEQALGDAALARLFGEVYGVTDAGNFEHGWSILNLPRTLTEHASAQGISEAELWARLEGARTTLLEQRYRRVPPLRDDKVLTSWNALLVSGLCRAAGAARVFDDLVLADRCTALAIQAAERLCQAHVRGIFDAPNGDGEVLRAAFEGQVHTRGYLEDVAFLGRACLDLHEATLDPTWRSRGRSFARHALTHYVREQGDGFYLTADDAETLIERTESLHDGAIPSGVGVMVELLLRLDASGVGSAEGRSVAEAVLERFVAAANEPFAYASLLTAATHAHPMAVHVTVRGPSADDARVQQLAATVRRARFCLESAVSLSYEVAAESDAISCRGQTCTAPTNDPETLAAELTHGAACMNLTAR
jgi:hypothetical protein